MKIQKYPYKSFYVLNFLIHLIAFCWFISLKNDTEYNEGFYNLIDLIKVRYKYCYNNVLDEIRDYIEYK